MSCHEVFQPPILFRVTKVKLQLEAQAIRVYQLLERQRQIAAKEQHMRLGVRREIGLDNAHDVERLGKGLVARLDLIDAGFDILVDTRLAQIALRNAERIELVSIDT